MQLYFAHPMSTYGSAHEKKALKAIKTRFPIAELVNPGDPKFVKAIKLLYPVAGFGLFDSIAAKSDILVAMPFMSGQHGAGVYSEIRAAERAGRKLLEIDPMTYAISKLDFASVECLSIRETRELNKEGKH